MLNEGSLLTNFNREPRRQLHLHETLQSGEVRIVGGHHIDDWNQLLLKRELMCLKLFDQGYLQIEWIVLSQMERGLECIRLTSNLFRSA